MNTASFKPLRQAARMVSVASISMSLAVAAWAQAAPATPAGLWQSVDDSTGQPRALIRITQANSVFTGVIERSLQPTPAGVVQRCELCTDDRKGQALIGMQMIRGIRQSGVDALWDGGEILDPDKGKSYKLQLRLKGDGKQLQVRGMVGPFFRNQTWNRVE
jgi:uncharacterized protein (DUF2147 family)